MNCTLTLCTAAALTVLTLNGGSLMPQKGKISIHGADGASFRQTNNVLILKREKPGIQLFLRGMIRFRPELKGTFAPDDALVLVLKTEKDATLRMRWRKNDKRMCHLPDFPIQGKTEFQKLVLPLPSTRGKDLVSLDLQFSPDPGQVEIKEIAVKYGFADVSHFTRRFRQLTGLTPGEIRKNRRSD